MVKDRTKDLDERRDRETDEREKKVNDIVGYLKGVGIPQSFSKGIFPMIVTSLYSATSEEVILSYIQDFVEKNIRILLGEMG
jgi:hypothetical protein